MSSLSATVTLHLGIGETRIRIIRVVMDELVAVLFEGKKCFSRFIESVHPTERKIVLYLSFLTTNFSYNLSAE